VTHTHALQVLRGSEGQDRTSPNKHACTQRPSTYALLLAAACPVYATLNMPPHGLFIRHPATSGMPHPPAPGRCAHRPPANTDSLRYRGKQLCTRPRVHAHMAPPGRNRCRTLQFAQTHKASPSPCPSPFVLLQLAGTNTVACRAPHRPIGEAQPAGPMQRVVHWTNRRGDTPDPQARTGMRPAVRGKK